jgi:hypothetical protein
MPTAGRVGKTTIAGTTNYLYDGANPVQELSGTTVTANLLTGLGVDDRFTRTDSNGTANFLIDALGSTIRPDKLVGQRGRFLRLRAIRQHHCNERNLGKSL